MHDIEALVEAVEMLLDKTAAQESLIFLLARYLIDTRVVTADQLAEHIRSYATPDETPGIRQRREFYAAVIGGDASRLP